MTNETTNSILLSTKQVLGISEEYTAFDIDILMHINSALTKLGDVGIGPPQGYTILGAEEFWSDFVGPTARSYNDVRTFVYLSVRLVFDPPASGYGIAAMERQLDEITWRINARREEENHPWITQTLPIE